MKRSNLIKKKLKIEQNNIFPIRRSKTIKALEKEYNELTLQREAANWDYTRCFFPIGMLFSSSNNQVSRVLARRDMIQLYRRNNR